ncbi:MAG: dehypoxanthine futalosine cyclase [Chthonomonadaceae bacterium]|nr:dehypoxanthine futalosine cyclase [Chthonomonadaceae bacterium]
MALAAPPDAKTIDRIADKVFSGGRVSSEDAIALFYHPNLNDLSAMADHVRMRTARYLGSHEAQDDEGAVSETRPIVTYVVGRILNYTNVCWMRCKFCAFYRPPGNDEGYTLSEDEILDKVADTVEKGGTEILFQGGLNPKLKVDWFEDIFRKIKVEFPGVNLHALSPAEINYVAHISKLSVQDCLKRLKEAGHESIPGAGGEILVDRVRELIAPYKDKTDEWLECMRTAAALGMRSSASMMFGHVETVEDRVEHLQRIRDLQDECGPFRAFVAWNFQPEETALPIPRKASAFDYLRTIAVARIYLDNIDHLQLSILTQGPKIAQIALRYGADDFGSTMIEENVVSAAGNKFILNETEFRRLIQDAGYDPKRRNTRYELVG